MTFDSLQNLRTRDWTAPLGTCALWVETGGQGLHSKKKEGCWAKESQGILLRRVPGPLFFQVYGADAWASRKVYILGI